ncbi:MAG: hypothetical protein ACRCSP_05955 [Rhodoglobus sp.]
MPGAFFDVRDYARNAAASHRDQLGLSHYISQPLSTDALRLVRYLHVLERATLTRLRSILVTAIHKDALITAFLTTWAFEKYWIADAFEQISLAHQPERHVVDRVTLPRSPEHTIREAIIANMIGLPMIGVHMTLETIDAWITQSAYRRLIALEPHQQLTQTLTAFSSIKERQLAFVEAQSRYRLTESPKTRRITRRRIAATRWPLGAATESRYENKFFFERLFRSTRELVDELDTRIDSLPGQSGLSVLRKAASL